MIIGTLLTSVFFTLCGFLIATKSNSVNGFLIRMIPWMILLVIPCFSLINFPYNWVFKIVPSVACINLVSGAYHGIPFYEAIILIIYMLIVNLLLLKKVCNVFEARIVYGG
jgi:fluoroquinolone transport system permease protein